MIHRLFGPRITIEVSILGTVGDRVLGWNGRVRLRAPADIREVLRRTGRAAGVDLLAALQSGQRPALVLDGERLDLPQDLNRPAVDGAKLSWLLPMAGGGL